MIENITKAAVLGQLTTVTCIDKVTKEEVEVLCVKVDGGLQPIGRLYPDTDHAMSDVSPPGGHSEVLNEQRILH